MHPMNPTTPAPHIPTPAHPLSTPRLPSNTGPTIPAPYWATAMAEIVSCRVCGDELWGPLEGGGLCQSCRDSGEANEEELTDDEWARLVADYDDDYEAPENDDCETEAEWLDRRLG